MISRYFIPVLLVLLSSFAIIFTVDQEYGKVTELLKQEEKLDQDIADAGTVEVDRLRLEQQYEKFPADANERLNAMIPDAIHPVRWIMEIQQIAVENGIEIKNPNVNQNLSGDAKTKASPLIETTIQFSSTGTYEQFRKFIGDIENSLQLREFSGVRLSLRSAETKGSAPVYIFDVQLTSRMMR